MKVLGLDTTTPLGSVALWSDGAVRALWPTDAGRPYSEQLPGVIDGLLRSVDMAAADVDVFAVASGPGSLTGLRVGISTVQGLAFALGRPVVGIPALEALATVAVVAPSGLAAGDFAGALIDAHRNEVFGALYVAEPEGPDGRGLSRAEGPSVGPAATVVARWAAVAHQRVVRVTGNAAKPCEALLVGMLGARATVLPPPLLAGTIAELGARRAARGMAILPHGLHPLYVRRPDAELARERQPPRRTPR